MQPITRDSLPHLTSCFADIGRRMLHSQISRAMTYWWRIELGSGCRFYGLPAFRRLPGSRIVIGPNCEFRSAQWSNFAGLTRRCSVSTLTRTALIEIGEDCGFSATAIAAAQHLHLGRRVMCGANVTIADSDFHAVDAGERAAGAIGKASPIVIHDDVWLGMNTIVLKGVEIGPRTIVGAGSVVTRSLPADVIAAGQPARVIREIESAPRLAFLEHLATG